MMNNVRTIYADMPATIGGYTICQDDYYTIVLNQNLSYDQNVASYYHELKHIKDKDFDSHMSADSIEKKRHNQ